MHDVVACRYLGGYRVHLRFDDDVEGTVDLSDLRFKGVLASLKDPREFAKVQVIEEAGTIGWPPDVELDPVVLYYDVREEPLPGAEEWGRRRLARRRARAASTPKGR